MLMSPGPEPPVQLPRLDHFPRFGFRRPVVGGHLVHVRTLLSPGSHVELCYCMQDRNLPACTGPSALQPAVV